MALEVTKKSVVVKAGKTVTIKASATITVKANGKTAKVKVTVK